jgi:hypothetical protein
MSTAAIKIFLCFTYFASPEILSRFHPLICFYSKTYETSATVQEENAKGFKQSAIKQTAKCDGFDNLFYSSFALDT